LAGDVRIENEDVVVGVGDSNSREAQHDSVPQPSQCREVQAIGGGAG
jgi:hypothetical protein